ncbi:MAG TPA: MG2 domain-containing protein, partial [Pyrinomonadaceae bacterium]|nr:MG2 domain-containing protein [Pyrinomonadaceae bacterium]
MIALLTPLTRARGELKVNEARTRFLLEKEPAEVLLAVENSTGETLNGKVELEIRDPQDRVISKVSNVQSIGTGDQTLKLSLPLDFSNFKTDDSHFLWLRLHYRVSKEGQSDSISQGIISLSEITPDLFELRVANPETAREGSLYRARVFASHPVTHKPAANVVIDGELTLEENDDKNLNLHSSKTTNSDGFAVLEFRMPKRFPQFPHEMRPAGGELKVVGKRGAFVAEAEDQALVDQFIRTLITTDKPLYQPGQMMHLRALVFTPSRHALANRNILFKIDDPEGTAVHRSVVKSSRFGIASTDWSIPENVRLGDYRIHVLVDGGNEEGEDSSEALYDVRISRYDLPNFTVTAQSDRDYYLPGQNAEVRVRADYLFGQPVKRGHVRVVRETQREWNYREQKWDVEEGDEQKGETDATGVFVARLDLSDDHKKLDGSDYDRFDDVTYQAYFTDSTTNRTEQRRFDVRVTKDPIHVYVIRENYRNRNVPLRFFVSTAYADGSPARCKVNVTLSNTEFDSRFKKREITTTPLLTLRTNRYGVAKVSGVPIPTDLEKEGEIELTVSATDSNGRTGKYSEDLRVDDDQMTSVETGKTLYRAGEPINVSITSTVRDETVLVELTRDSNLIRSERVRIRNGRGSVTFPYTPEFKDQITIAAFPMLLKHRTIEASTILYPRDVELKVNARASQTTYRPGENAHVTLNVRAPEGSSAESALSVVVSDKAVAERYRTTQEFGGNNFNYSDSLKQFMEVNLKFAGVTLRDLQRLDTSKVISRDLDLVAEVMLNQGRNYTPQFFGGDQYDTSQAYVFAELIKRQFEPVKELLTRRYLSKTQYPDNEASLNTLLSAEKIDPAHMLDPWGIPYRPVFSLEGPADVLTFMSAGADKRFGTPDDFSVERFSWRYFLPLGAVIDLAIRHYHERTGGYIHDVATLREELSKAGVVLDQLR